MDSRCCNRPPSCQFHGLAKGNALRLGNGSDLSRTGRRLIIAECHLWVPLKPLACVWHVPYSGGGLRTRCKPRRDGCRGGLGIAADAMARRAVPCQRLGRLPSARDPIPLHAAFASLIRGVAMATQSRAACSTLYYVRSTLYGPRSMLHVPRSMFHALCSMLFCSMLHPASEPAPLRLHQRDHD